jgi:hypothetical protein
MAPDQRAHPAPWSAGPMWKSTPTPWVVRDRYGRVFATVDDERTARAIAEWGSTTMPTIGVP